LVRPQIGRRPNVLDRLPSAQSQNGTSLFERRRTDRPCIAVVAAARPNFMKVGPVVEALRNRADVALVHTGQHYDERMSEGFFRDLGLPEPDVNLSVGSGSHAEQTAAVMVAFEGYLFEHPTDAVVVVGDVNSTVAAAMAAVKLRVPVAHVEAGLRSRDWGMPEEINRVLTDRISRWLFTPSPDGDANLAAEGVPTHWVHHVGNVMIDTLYANLDRARERGSRARTELDLNGEFGLMTLHRPSNVDEAGSLDKLLATLGELAGDNLQLVFPAHPRTSTKLRAFGVTIPPQVRIVDPLGYLDFVGLMAQARVVLTDSGGVQEETSVLGVPCLTLRENTERPITCELGTNRLVGLEPADIREGFAEALAADRQPRSIPLWDGKAGERVAGVLLEDLAT
jgi:UDP-N-acetylglucosamine 2-epimerase (non-hydrolysing)